MEHYFTIYWGGLANFRQSYHKSLDDLLDAMAYRNGIWAGDTVAECVANGNILVAEKDRTKQAMILFAQRKIK